MISPIYADKAPEKIFGIYSKKIFSCVTAENKPEGVSCNGFVEDQLELSPKENNKIEAKLKLHFIDNNICRLQGVGIWEKNKILIEKKDKKSKQKCVLEFLLSQNEVTIQSQGACSQYCGSRGSFDGASLKKKENSDKKTPPQNKKIPIPTRL